MTCDRSRPLLPSPPSPPSRGRAAALTIALLVSSVPGCATSVPACPEGLTECSGRCVDTRRDPSHCGACGEPCGEGEVCDGEGSCELRCQEGFVDCEGLCVDPRTNRAFCGASMDCSGDDAGERCGEGARCVDGACVPTCPSGFLACADTCVDPATSNAFCGAEGACEGDDVGEVCPPGQLCSGGACAPNCAEGLLACDGECVEPRSDVRYCGAANDCTGDDAGVACAFGELCVDGVCRVECAIDRVLCDGRCIDPQTDSRYCGADDDCMGRDAGATCGDGELCARGRCRVSCGPGLVECDGGCIDPLTNNLYCGVNEDCFAGTVCAGGQLCDGGSCRGTCLETSVQCGTRCIDPMVNRSFCGASDDCAGANAGEECADGTICLDGVCAPTCPEGFIDCDGLCTDPMTSTLFCGATGDCTGADAGQACGGGELCLGGVCCPAGQLVCGGSCVDPATDTAFCGASGDCMGTNAGTACTGTDVCFGGQCVAPGGGTLETEVFDIVDRGWWDSAGTHDPANQNTFTGWADTDVGPAFVAFEFNSYYTFDLSGAIEDAVAIEAVTLRLELMAAPPAGNGGYFSPDPSESFTMWDVSTDPVTLDSLATSTTPNVAVHTDLESGVSYGTGTVSAADQGTIQELVLNADAQGDVLDALGTTFAIGMASDSADTARLQNDGFRWSDGSRTFIHQLIVTYRTMP